MFIIPDFASYTNEYRVEPIHTANYTGQLSATGNPGMSFLKHTSHRLTAAIATALLVQYQPAFANQNSWNCQQVDNKWDCSGELSLDEHSSADFSSTTKAAAEAEHTGSDNSAEQIERLTQSAGTDAETIKQTQKSVSSTSPIAGTTTQTETSTEALAEPLTKASHTEAPFIEAPFIETLSIEAPSIETPTIETPSIEAQGESQNNLTPSKASNTEVQSESSLPQSAYAHLGWYPYAKGQSPNHCSGRYIEPALPEDDGTPFQFKPIIVDASEARTELGLGTELTGSVKIVQGSRSLYSDSATINQETGDINISGGATYREPGLLFTGKTAQSNTNTKKTTLNDAEYVLFKNNIRGSVAQISRNEDATITIQEGNYTQCPPDSNTWNLVAKEIHLDKESGFGWAKHATLKVSDIPVLYLPYFQFPIDDKRHTGFLYPSIRYSDTEGLDLSTPYYFNIAPNIDDTLTPRFLEKRGILLENELRYMNAYSTNSLSTAYLPNDSVTNQDRWLFGIKHTGKPADRWLTKINYLSVSDDDYFDDLGTTLDAAEESHLNRSGSVTYYGNQWQSEFLLQSYQTIDEDNITPYRRLPQLQVSGDPTLGPDWLSASYLLQLTQFDRDITDLTDSDRVTGSRLHIEPELTATFRSASGYIKPAIKLWHSQYSLDDQVDGMNDSPSISAPVISIDSGLFFDRDYSLFNTHYQQTLEPRLYALYVPEQDQSAVPDFDTTTYSFDYASLFRSNRFSGYDRIGDTQQLSLGVSSRLIDQKGREAITASIGQAIYYNDRTVELDDSPLTDGTSDFSDIATSVIWRPNKRLNINFNANFDHEDVRATEHNVAVRYQDDINRIVSLSYRFSEDIREQSTAAFIWPVSKTWSALGVWQYDWLTNDSIDTAIGLEYESCCWKTRIVTRHWLTDEDEKDTALYLQFVLKGLGSFGRSGGSDFAEKITGFEQREEIND